MTIPQHTSGIRRKKLSEQAAFWLFRLMSIAVVGVLFWIQGFIIVKGIGVISWEFLTGMPRDGMTAGGILPAIVGTLCLTLGSIVIAFPLGILSGIYISEYTRDNWLVKLIRIMTNNLSGVPSIVFGLFGMALFVNTLGFGDSIIAGSFTLALLVLPIVIRTTEEALRRIDDSYRLGSLALGATKLQTIRRVLLPMAMPNIITGLILSVGRVSGETAPILFTAVAYFLPKLPSSIFDQVMALPYHLYVIATSGTDLEATRPMAYGTALVLIAIVLVINLAANGLRRYFNKKVKMN
ncbi:phosphate ABC transporter permease PstA [Alistipes indistinctus]|uniref:Phosphate transport system permease protein PstA n=2 Tax=Alistipes indistinctus TaxID=626932 RepID=G5H6G2_9BACT|nr:phosphate ABC transporter permease PstA [Alistipes indistinctus]EHB92973.1 phosphate ABC transporter, permease PstA [Alistipes indistinctus YIT 12060]UWN59245.1 phosphate ABC transporter permease PstA [Alistipes indistinctus YIT 12060]